jgi:hypothetical protein
MEEVGDVAGPQYPHQYYYYRRGFQCFVVLDESSLWKKYVLVVKYIIIRSKNITKGNFTELQLRYTR